MKLHHRLKFEIFKTKKVLRIIDKKLRVFYTSMEEHKEHHVC